jgi:hypothetical protein
MARAPEIGLLIADCWQQLLQLRKSLAELEKFNTQGWQFLTQAHWLLGQAHRLLGQAHRLPSTANTTCSRRIDPESWRKRAEEARALADMITNTEAKRSLAEIAESYERWLLPKKIQSKARRPLALLPPPCYR